MAKSKLRRDVNKRLQEGLTNESIKFITEKWEAVKNLSILQIIRLHETTLQKLIPLIDSREEREFFQITLVNTRKLRQHYNKTKYISDDMLRDTIQMLTLALYILEGRDYELRGTN